MWYRDLFLIIIYFFVDVSIKIGLFKLVVNHECVKLADFGLSREVDENMYLGNF